MSKKKDIVLEGEAVTGPIGPPFEPVVKLKTRIAWVGPRRPNERYDGYIRLEVNGRFAGSPSVREMRRLKKWLDAYFEERAQ